MRLGLIFIPASAVFGPAVDLRLKRSPQTRCAGVLPQRRRTAFHNRAGADRTGSTGGAGAALGQQLTRRKS